jgi:hypothetical protein
VFSAWPLATKLVRFKDIPISLVCSSGEILTKIYSGARTKLRFTIILVKPRLMIKKLFIFRKRRKVGSFVSGISNRDLCFWINALKFFD